MQYKMVTDGPYQWIGATMTTVIKNGGSDIGPFLRKHYVAHIPTITTVGLEAEDPGIFLQRQQENNTLARIPNKVDSHLTFSGYTDYSRPISFESTYTYILGAFVTNFATVPDDMKMGTVPATKFAVFTVKGPAYKVVPEFWQWLWSKPHDFERAFSFDYELYDSASDEIKIYISIL
ncbi:MAG TPA: GyrI-like domain-containing protein [Candidatus Limnocylindria bacterium]|nr:GyrI-like domain-containing protein [Candidatus Limnocylindria bacterium]